MFSPPGILECGMLGIRKDLCFALHSSRCYTVIHILTIARHWHAVVNLVPCDVACSVNSNLSEPRLNERKLW